MYLVFTCMPGESYHRWLRSLLLYLCYIFWALINSLVCWFYIMKVFTLGTVVWGITISSWAEIILVVTLWHCSVRHCPPSPTSWDLGPHKHLSEDNCALNIPQQLTFLYRSMSMHSSCERRTRLVPTRMRNSRLSCSRRSRSREWPWCCIRTHSLFISAKFSWMKSTESITVPESLPLE